MNAKQLKFLQLFAAMSKNSALDNSLLPHLKHILQLDYNMGLETWQYFVASYENELTKDKAFAALVGQSFCSLFYEQNKIKCIRAIYDTPLLKKAVFQYNPNAYEGISFNILTDTLLSGKLIEGEELLKSLLKNTCISYGAVMKNVLEKLFDEAKKKSPSKKIDLGKKLTALMLTYIAKIKTDERAILTQRINEIF